MKKRLLALLLSALLLTSATACNPAPESTTTGTGEHTTTVSTNPDGVEETSQELKNDENDNTEGSVASSQTTYSTQEIIDLLGLSDSYASVLKCESTFFYRNQEQNMYLYDYTFSQSQSSSWNCISLVDMDGDGNVEMILDGLYNTLVFRVFDGKMYAYSFYFRSMNDIRKNGTFLWNSNAGRCYGTARLEFEGDECKYIELNRIEYAGTPDEKYYIDGKDVTLEEMNFYLENQSLADKTDRYQWNRDSIPSSVESAPTGK